jgi:hypothetical protein
MDSRKGSGNVIKRGSVCEMHEDEAIEIILFSTSFSVVQTTDYHYITFSVTT